MNTEFHIDEITDLLFEKGFRRNYEFRDLLILKKELYEATIYYSLFNLVVYFELSYFEEGKKVERKSCILKGKKLKNIKSFIETFMSNKSVYCFERFYDLESNLK